MTLCNNYLKMKTYTLLALFAGAQAHRLVHKESQNAKHACDFIDDKGEEISTSLMPESLVQLSGDINDDDVASTKQKFAQMQAQMDAAVAQADAKRAEQQQQYENNI